MKPLKILAVGLFLLLTYNAIYPANNLIYLELQGVAGYHSSLKELVFYSHHSHDTMQKPSIGMDYTGRLRAGTSDFGYLSIQARLAYDEHKDSYLEPQLYNAYLNLKLKYVDIWTGHNKTAIGLSSYLDNHSLLLADNSMGNLNFDRDWGVGMTYEGSNYDIKGSLTAGSGMPLYLENSFLAAFRVGLGNLAMENRTVGFSAGYGDILMSMGYQVMHNGMRHNLMIAGADFSYRYLNWEAKGDLLIGDYHSQFAYALLTRIERFFFPEDRLTVSLQNISRESLNNSDQSYSLGLSYRISPYTTLRTMYNLHNPGTHHSFVIQAFFLRGYLF